MSTADIIQVFLLSLSILILIYAFIEMNKKVNETVKSNEELKEKVNVMLNKIDEHFSDKA